jgi:glucose-6-phosphate 1-dehydrogenase
VRGTGGNHAFYLSIPPRFFSDVVGQLKEHGLAEQHPDTWRRVVVEKPFGHDLKSARQLNAIISEVFPPESVFRIDHYLGKETVQNILAMRFANSMFEPIWNANYVDHVQITMAEDIGIGGRAGYYDGIGAARDVIQNHLLQLMALIAMEEPTAFDANSLRIEKQKVLQSVVLPRRLDLFTARGQYTEGWAGGVKVPGYTDEQDIPSTSRTETYAAVKLGIETRRWAGVPFYLRTGKRLGRRVTEVAVVFKRAPHLPFTETSTEELTQNALVIRVQPDEGVTLRFGAKVPGTAMEIRDVNMDFAYGGTFTESSPEAYERLILDVLLGEPPLFPRHEEVELSWKILDPIENYWADHGKPDTYPSGTWGPVSADRMLARDGRTWRRP